MFFNNFEYVKSRENQDKPSSDSFSFDDDESLDCYMDDDIASSRPIFVIDNGAHTIKMGYSTQEEPRVIPNCIQKSRLIRNRIFIGDQIDQCGDRSGLYYDLPTEKGYITKWEYQKPIWDYVLGKDCCNVDLSETSIVLTEPMFNFTAIQEATNEIFFEEYGVPSLFKGNPTDFVAYNYANFIKAPSEPFGCCVVVDSGYSFTHVVPYAENRKCWNGIGRINFGGKLLTNHLKEIISYRQLNVMNETCLINQVKEDSCFVSQNFNSDMETAAKEPPENTIIREYVLPDYNVFHRGFLRTVRPEGVDLPQSSNRQKLLLNNERFCVPEILFNPPDIELKQQGIGEAVPSCIARCPQKYRAFLTKNLVLTGGSTKFPGYTPRFTAELRKATEDFWDVAVTAALDGDAVTGAWKSACQITRDVNFERFSVTRKDYEEYGSAWAAKQFEMMVYSCPLKMAAYCQKSA